MANRFWVPQNGTLTWAATGPTNWGSSSGTSDGASVPGTGDVAIFDGNSGTGNSIIGASTTIQGLDCTGGTGNYAGTITHNSNVTLTINTGAASSLRFSSGMTYTPVNTASLITFTHTSGTANITSNGQRLAALTINGAGGTTTLLDALLVNALTNATLTVTSGVFDAQNGAGGPFAVTTPTFFASGSTTRTVTLGGTLTIGGAVTNGATILTFQTTTNLTFNKNSCNVVVLTPTSSIGGVNIFLGGLTWNDLTLNASTTGSLISFSVAAGATLSHFVNSGGWSVVLPTTALTVSNAFTWTGTQANPIMVMSSSTSAGLISCPSGACTLTWGGLLNITASGGATFTATNTLNYGNATGWSVTTPSDSSTTLLANTVTSLDATMSTVAKGTVTTGASTTSLPTSAFTINGTAASGVVADEFKERVVIFRGDTTTAGLRGAQAAISASSASNTPTLTVGTLPDTPVAGDIFRVV